MKVLVIGAGGKTGKLVVEQALAAGHQVTALVHEKKEDEVYPAAVDVVHGDVRNPSRLDQVMTGQHAVIDTIGGKRPFLKTELEEDAARTLIEVMQRNGVKRLIVISVLGEGDSIDQAPWLYRHILVPVYLHGAMPDKAKMEQEVGASGLEYVIVRPPVLSDAQATGSVKVVAPGEIAHRITRGDLAHFLVEQLTSDTYVGHQVTIANT